jgi:hypothetical protein
MESKPRSKRDRETRLMIALAAVMLALPLGAWRAAAALRRTDPTGERLAEAIDCICSLPYAFSPCHRCSLADNAIGTCRTYVAAQTMFKRVDWDGDGELEYAADFTDLHNQLDGSGEPIWLIDSAFASAKGTDGQPKHGYLFQEMKTIAGRPIDWAKECALCAIPSVYGRTGYRTFIVGVDGTVFGLDQGEDGTFVDDYPADPPAEGWIIAE